jgi:ribosome-binding protein aMBF1 (putative translation factor)
MATHKLDSLKAQREAAGHSITTLAKKAALSDGLIRRAENGDFIEAHYSQRIADALGVSLATLGKREL